MSPERSVTVAINPFPDKVVIPTVTTYEAVTSIARAHQVASLTERAIFQSEAIWLVQADYPNAPIAILWASDIHYGGDIDYDLLTEHFNIVESTPNFYIIIGGDHNNNMTDIGKAQFDVLKHPSLQRDGIYDRIMRLDKKYKVAALLVGQHDEFNTDIYNRLKKLRAPIYPQSGGTLQIQYVDTVHTLGLIHAFRGRSEAHITNAGKKALYHRFEGVMGVFIGDDHRLGGEVFVSDSGVMHVVLNGGTYLLNNGASHGARAGATLLIYPHSSSVVLTDIYAARDIISTTVELAKLKKSMGKTKP
jgi:hypothetical protein